MLGVHVHRAKYWRAAAIAVLAVALAACSGATAEPAGPAATGASDTQATGDSADDTGSAGGDASAGGGADGAGAPDTDALPDADTQSDADTESDAEVDMGADASDDPDAAPATDGSQGQDTGSGLGSGPPPGPAVPPPEPPTWTAAGGCVLAQAAPTPPCAGVVCPADAQCLGNGVCTPVAPFSLGSGLASEVAPALASRADGAWAVAWYDGTLDTEMHVFLQVSLAGNAVLGPPLQVDAALPHWAYAPAVTALQDGTWLVAWRDEQFFQGTVRYFGQRVATDGSFLVGAPFEITAGPQWAGGGSTNVVSPLAVRLRNDQVLVAWPSADQPGSLLGVHARLLDVAGTPLGGELATGALQPGTESYSPAIAPMPNGACLLAWQSWSQKGHVQVLGRRLDSGGAPVGGVAALSAGSKAYEALPAVAAFADGAAFLSWKDGDITTSTTPVAISGRAWSADAVPVAAGKPQAIGQDPDGTYPDQGPVATLPGDRVAIAWHSAATSSSIYVRRYYRNLDALDCQTLDVAGPLAPGEDGPRHLPALETLADGRLLVAWTTLIAGVPQVRVRILGG